MEPNDEELLLDLLMRWEELRDRGQAVSVEELCRNRPDLKDELSKRIKALEATSWLETPCDDDEPPECVEPFPSATGPKVFSGRYRLDAIVAEGGFAQVWKGTDLELKRVVAIKIPKPSRLQSTEAFLAEARRVARLKHDRIVPVFDVGHEGSICFIVSEYVEGGSLKAVLAAKTPERDQAISWTADIADALEYAHKQGIVHRDIKPANILIDHNDRAKLADFGIAQSPLKAGQSLGTLKYMSPEQLAGKSVDARSDIFSLGVVLHEVLTGERFSPGRLPTTPIRPSKALPRHLRNICQQCFAQNPDDRFPTAAGLAEALRFRSWVRPALLFIVLGVLLTLPLLLLLKPDKQVITVAAPTTVPLLPPLSEDEQAQQKSAAVRIIELNGRVHVAGVSQPVTTVDQLPNAFRISSVTLRDSAVQDQDLEQILVATICWLNLTQTQITDAGMKYLEQLPNLQQLRINGTAIGDDGFKCLRANVSLTFLECRNTGITDESCDVLANLQNLQHLDLEGTTVGDAGLEKLASLKSLRELRIGGTNVSPPAVTRLEKALPQCKIVARKMNGGGVY